MATPLGSRYDFGQPLSVARRVVRDVMIGWSGLREGVFEIAERLNRRVQLLRWSTEAAEHERTLNELYRQLGQQIEQTHLGLGNGGDLSHTIPATSATGALATDPNMSHVVEAVMHVKAELERLERRMRALKAEGREDEVESFLQALWRSGGRVEVVSLPPDSPAVGLRLPDLRLPEDVRLVGLQRGQVVLTVQDDLSLMAGDRLLIVGPDRAMDEAVARLAWPSGRNAPH